MCMVCEPLTTATTTWSTNGALKNQDAFNLFEHFLFSISRLKNGISMTHFQTRHPYSVFAY